MIKKAKLPPGRPSSPGGPGGPDGQFTAGSAHAENTSYE